MGQHVCRGLRPMSVDEGILEVEVNWVSADPMFQPIPCDNQFLATTIACDNQFIATTIACDNHRVRQTIPCDNQFLATTNSS